MILIGRIDCEWHTVQTLAADDTTEALGMIRFAVGAQNTFENRFHAHRTLLQRIQVVLFTAWFVVERIEWFALQRTLTLHTLEAIDVINLLHGRAAGILADHSIATLHTSAKYFRIGIIAAHVHRLHQ